MEKRKYYVVDEVPSKHKTHDAPEHLYYVHAYGYPDIPVFGSFGTKKEAAAVCRTYNLDGKVHYACAR